MDELNLDEWVDMPRNSWQYIPTGSMIRYTDDSGDLKIGGEFMECFTSKSGTEMIRIRGKIGNKKSFVVGSDNVVKLYKKKNMYDRSFREMMNRVSALEDRMGERRNSSNSLPKSNRNQ